MTETKAIAYKLLSIQRQQDTWHDEINASSHIEIDDPIGGDLLLLELALDILGEPKDNTIETNALEVAARTGDWPDWAHCRDWAGEMYCLMVRKHGDIDGYMKVVTGEIEIPETVGPNDEDIEAYLYT